MDDRSGDDEDGAGVPVGGDAGPARGGMGATVVSIVAGLVMVAGLAIVVIALSRGQADDPPQLSTPATNVEVVPLPAVAGCWAVAPDDRTFVGYRINEQLLSVETSSEVTGRTRAVDGGLVIRQDQVVVGVVAADLRELTSDDPERDEALRTRGLETETYPSAVFALSEPVRLPAPLDPGEPIELEVTGELTLHGVTQTVTLTVQAQLIEVDGDLAIELVGTAPIDLADYGIDPPDVGGVLTVADDGLLELQLVLVEDPSTCAAIAAGVEEDGGAPSEPDADEAPSEGATDGTSSTTR